MRFLRSETTALIPSGDNEYCCKDHEFDDYKARYKSRYNIIREFSLGCFTPNRHWRISGSRGVDDPHSDYSSFRFNLCTQMELEPITVNRNSSSATKPTVLMVNLENSFLTDSSSAEAKSRRFELLERTISPVRHSLIRFSYSEILSATKSFSKGRVLGRGGLSCVYRGRVGYLKTALAIKRLDKEDEESSNAFCRELMIASSLHNPHIDPLVGFCIDVEEGLFLVYKYSAEGSLEHFLHERKRKIGGGPSLSWSARYKIAVGIAEVIAYLHNGTDRCVVHRDIKPSNILLSSAKKAMLCDFGLALSTPASSVPLLCETVKGTFGYLAPEYFQHGKVSDKTDVYAFGVVLLELMTGRRPIEPNRGPNEENLVLWAKPLLQQGRCKRFLGPKLKITRKNSLRIMRMVLAATACLENEESCRPNMRAIITVLRGEETPLA